MTTRKAMVLAAGRGKRMRPLTDSLPKPLVEVGGKPLIAYHLEGLSRAGITDVVINHAHLGEQIESALGDGSDFGVTIQYSPEPEGGLETAGGIFKALAMLGEKPFVVVNADVWTNYDYARLLDYDLSTNLAHLVMVNNPSQHPHGDFYLSNGGRLALEPPGQPLTYAGVGLFCASFFDNFNGGRHPLLPLFQATMQQQQLSGEYFDGDWDDVGTLDRLEALRARVE